jgi:aminopeptidase N
MGGYLVPYFYDQTAIFQPDTLVTLTVPDPGGLVQGVSDGVLISQESQPGAATFSFSFATGEVFPSYMAFFGALETFESSWNGLPVACVLAAANAEYGQPCLDMVADVLSFHSDLYGDYPFGSIKVIEGGPIAAGGYGAPANVVLNSDVVAYFDYSFAGVISHELGHQWWGAGVTFNGPGATPMTEGLAEVSACQYQRLVLDQTRCLAQASRGYLATLPAGKDLPLNDPTIAYDAGDWALTLIYSKGHVALQAGRLALGDEAFFGGLRALAAQGGMLPSEALFEALSAQAGASQVDAYLRPWFEQGGHPRVSLSRGVGEDGGLTLQVSQPDEPRFAFPLPVALDTLDGSQARLVLVPAEATAQVTVPDAPATASCLALNGEQELPLEVPAATQADPDLDGVVNGSDLLLLMRYFGLVGYDAQYNYANAAFSPVVDFDGSGVIDQGDLDLLTARFGQPVE